MFIILGGSIGGKGLHKSFQPHDYRDLASYPCLEGPDPHTKIWWLVRQDLIPITSTSPSSTGGLHSMLVGKTNLIGTTIPWHINHAMRSNIPLLLSKFFMVKSNLSMVKSPRLQWTIAIVDWLNPIFLWQTRNICFTLKSPCLIGYIYIHLAVYIYICTIYIYI